MFRKSNFTANIDDMPTCHESPSASPYLKRVKTCPRRGLAPLGAGSKYFDGAKAPPGAGSKNFAGALPPPGSGLKIFAEAKAPPRAGQAPKAPAKLECS